MTDRLLTTALDWAECGRIPDPLIRWGIRRLCRERLREEDQRDPARQEAAVEQFVARMQQGPVAPLPEKANEQHYEAPTELFQRVLGPCMKYSCCYWPEGVTSLEQAEEAALRITCERAQIEDGLDILELGCGWGSLSLWMAEHYPGSRITAVSNSRTQREFIEQAVEERGLANLQVVTADMNDFDTREEFDRVVSVEMFEHMRNYDELLRRISTWMRPTASLFIHVFCHRRFAYEFQTEGADNWMGRYFFTGGIMPSEDLLLRFPRDVQVARQWRWSGVHYERTANAWLARLDAARDDLLPALAKAYGPAEAVRWFHRWRLFFLACAELWGYRGGREWLVAHYLLRKQTSRTRLQIHPADLQATAA
jgi:cyclopropane-fatty-acyl-phospholipid synthase